jgi:hypothetical protein
VVVQDIEPLVLMEVVASKGHARLAASTQPRDPRIRRFEAFTFAVTYTFRPRGHVSLLNHQEINLDVLLAIKNCYTRCTKYVGLFRLLVSCVNAEPRCTTNKKPLYWTFQEANEDTGQYY